MVNGCGSTLTPRPAVCGRWAGAMPQAVQARARPKASRDRPGLTTDSPYWSTKARSIT
jgi:hypothetical protein